MQTAREPRLFTVQEYMKLDIPGHTELLGGVVYNVSPRYPPHTHAVRHLNAALSRGLTKGYIVSPQDPIAVQGWTGKSSPETDIAVIAEKVYLTTPTDADSFAYVEVSDATYKDDREEYIPLYVAASVPTWHVNIPARQVEFYEKGSIPGGSPSGIFVEGDVFDILGVPIHVVDLFLPKKVATKKGHCDDLYLGMMRRAARARATATSGISAAPSAAPANSRNTRRSARARQTASHGCTSRSMVAAFSYSASARS